ncbi:MAG: DinB family protein [Acidimicrobiia bacterium]
MSGFFGEIRSIGRSLRAKVTGTASRDDPLGVRKPERETLAGFMDWYRQVVINKVDGLSFEDASRVMTPTGMSPLGIVKHLTWAEAGWFRDTFAGKYEGEEASNEDSFVIAPGDTIESVVAAYRDECEHSRRIAARAPSLNALSVGESQFRGLTSLRWILIHMIDETARHAGHLDIMREQIDGRTGD